MRLAFARRREIPGEWLESKRDIMTQVFAPQKLSECADIMSQFGVKVEKTEATRSMKTQGRKHPL